MRVGIVCCCNGDKKILEYAQGFVKGIEKQGEYAEIVDMEKDPDKKLTIFNYLIVGTGAASPFSGKIPGKVRTFLKNSGNISGKRCVAFTNKKGLFSGKRVLNLMKAMEAEGMFLKNSYTLKSAADAEAFAAKLKIK